MPNGKYSFLCRLSRLTSIVSVSLRSPSHSPHGACPFCLFATFSPFHRGNLPRRGKQEYSDSGKYNFAEQNITAAGNITSQRKISLVIRQILLPQRGTPRASSPTAELRLVARQFLITLAFPFGVNL